MKNRALTSLLCLLVIGFLTPLATAQSVELRLQDGTRWRGAVGDQIEVRVVERGSETTYTGELVNAADLWIQVRVESEGRERVQTVFRGDIRSIKHVDAEPADRPSRPSPRPEEPESPRETPAEAPARSQPTTPARTGERQGDKPGVFLLPLTGQVGLEFRHQEIEAIARHADEYGPGQIIVLEIESGGGLVIEMEKIAQALREAKQRHRIVAWIREAISAGAATAAFCDEIYFSREGALGSMTMVAGGGGVERNRQLQWADRAGEWFHEGGRHPFVARAMILADAALSYDKDSVTGNVTWYNDLSGEYILSRPGQNLTFNASNAVASGFAQGVADTTEDLAKLLDLPEWHEVSDYGRRIHANWVRDVERAQQEIQRSRARMTYSQTGSRDQVRILGARIQELENIIRWAERVPNVAFFMNIDVDELRRDVANLRHELATLQRQRRGGGRR